MDQRSRRPQFRDRAGATMCTYIGRMRIRFARSGRLAALALTVLAALPASTPAHAGACPARVNPSFGETVDSIAARCGVTPEALRSRNPGLDADSPQIGIRIEVPRPALPSPQIEVGGNRGIVAPAQPTIRLPRL